MAFSGGLRCGADRRGRSEPSSVELGANFSVPDSPGVQPVSLGARVAAVPAQAAGEGSVVGAQHDSVGVVHDEAERDDRDDPRDVAGAGESASVRARGPGAGVPADVRGAGRAVV